MIDFKLKGSKAMQRKIQRIASSNVDRIATALRIEAELIMTKSKQKHVPVDLGTLRSSGFVNDVERSGRDLSVTLGYGGAASAYALAVHEHPSSASPPSWQGKSAMSINWRIEGRGPKYLEFPLMQAVPTMLGRMAKRLNVESMKGSSISSASISEIL